MGEEVEQIEEGGMPSSVIKTKQKYDNMTPKEFVALHGHRSKKELEDMAWRHGYGKGSQFYVDKAKKGRELTNEEVEATKIEEKHLTPAEMKKREEIAHAMEREKPGMSMKKKMRIATAAAIKSA